MGCIISHVEVDPSNSLRPPLNQSRHDPELAPEIVPMAAPEMSALDLETTLPSPDEISRILAAAKEPKWSPRRLELELDDPWLDNPKAKHTRGMICRVQGCPCPEDTHSTLWHICETCVNAPNGRRNVAEQCWPATWAFGHGPHECGSGAMRSRLLEQVAKDKKGRGGSTSCCRIDSCVAPRTHLSSQHQCSRGCLGHADDTCPLAAVSHNTREQRRESRNIVYRASRFDFIPESTWCTQPGCSKTWTHTNEGHDDKLYATDEVVPDGSLSMCTVCCPKCRTDNRMPRQPTKPVFADDVSTCCCCLESDATVLLPMCGHLCLCPQCWNKLVKD